MKNIGSILLFILLSCKQEIRLNIETYKQNDGGYGYLIKSGQKILIKQDFIPTLSGELHFCTKEDAKKVASLVKNKILQHQSPSITSLEIKHMEIKTNCSNKK